MSIASSRPLLSIEGLGRALVILLWVNVALAVVSGLDDILSLLWLNGKDPGGVEFLYSQPTSWAIASILVTIVLGLVWAATMVLWIVWQYRVTRNVEVWGIGMRRGTGWAIWAWFVPIVSLWFPPQQIHDVMRGSRPDAAPAGRADQQSSEPVVGWWWFAFLLSNFTAGIASSAFSAPYENGDWILAYRLDLLSQVPEVIAAVLAIRVVNTITSRQGARIEASRQFWSTWQPMR